METPNKEPKQDKQQDDDIILDKNDPDSIYNWVAKKVSGPSFRNIIKDFIDDNCSLFIDIEENTFQQGQIFNEFNQLLENILNDVLEEGGLTQDQFLEAAQRGLEDKKYKKYFDQILNFGDYNFFKRCMTKRNYALIKKFEEQISQQKKEIEEQRIQEEEKNKQLEKELEMEKEKEKELEMEKEKEKEDKKEDNKEKTEKELEEERQRMLLLQMLNQEEEKELQEVIKQSLAMEEEKRRMAVIEEEELNRALKQSLLESNNPPNKPEEPKKEEQKKPDYQIQKNENFIFENQPKEEKKPIPPPKKPISFISSSNTSFQVSGLTKDEEKKPEKPTNINLPNKGFEFQVQSNNNNFGISSQNIPEDKKQDLIDDDGDKKGKKEKRDIQYKDISLSGNKKPEIEKVEIQRKKEEIKEKKFIIDNNNNNINKNNNNLIQFEDNAKDENIIVTDEIKTKVYPKPSNEPQIPIQENQNQKASDIIKQSLNDNKINENNINENNNEENENIGFGGYDRLLISDDEDEEDKKDSNIEQKPLSNVFIDTKKDINLGKVQIGKDGGNFLNNFSEPKKYEKGGLEKLENKFQLGQIKSVESKPNEDDDYLAKLKEVEKEKNEKLKEYREKLTQMQKEKRENKAKQTLSPEELAKLQRREQLAQRLKAKRFKENKP